MRKLALLLVVAFAFLLVATAPAQAGRRWVAPAPAPALDNGSAQCGSDVSYNQWHNSSNPTVSRSGALGVLERDTTGLGLGFQACTLPPNPTLFDDTTGGAFMWVGLYARNGWTGNSCNGDTYSCTIKFGVDECYSDGFYFPWCNRAYVDDPQQGNIFVYTKGCGATNWYDLGQTDDQTLGVQFALYADGNFKFYANGVLKLTLPSTTSSLSCWAPNGVANRGAIYGTSRWDDYDSIGQVNGYGSRITGAKFGVYNAGWSSVNWTTGSCNGQAPDADCIRIAPDILRFESY